MLREIQQLAERLRKYESSIQATASPIGIGGTKEFGELQAKSDLLESRIPLTSLHTLDGKIFQSRTDVMLYMEKKMPSNMFYLFHDAVTLLEYLLATFQVRKDVLVEHYQSKKLEITAQESRHIPYVFGYVEEGANSKYPLHALKLFSDWNSNDQDWGVKNFIIQGMAVLAIPIYFKILLMS